MELATDLKELVESLILFKLDKGVSPTELMGNFMNSNYLTSIKQKKNETICEIIFEDEEFFGNNKVIYKYIYMYDNEMYLQRIILNGTSKQTIWDRQEEEDKLLKKIINTNLTFKLQEIVNEVIENFQNESLEITLGNLRLQCKLCQKD